MADHLWQWLQTEAGLEATHAVIGLVQAVTVYILWRVHSHQHDISTLLDGHLQDHERQSADNAEKH